MFDATVDGQYCLVQPQEIAFPKNGTEDGEDCLRVNVYKNNADFTTKVPVIVNIHGGGFVMGSSNESFNGPDLLMKKDVLLVTLNYRLGLLGKQKRK